MSNALKSPSDDRAAQKQLEREINRLDASIRKFRIDSQRFFGGDLKLPPDELREKIASDLRRLRGASRKGAAVNFRLGSLEAKFQSHQDLFGHRLRERERGEMRLSAEAEAKAPDPKTGVVLGPKADSRAVAALYQGLYRRNPKMDLEKFRSYIERQADVIRSKTGCQDIQFRIAVQDGKVKLKARPIHHGSST